MAQLTTGKGSSRHKTAPLITPLSTVVEIIGVSSRDNGKAKEVMITSLSSSAYVTTVGSLQNNKLKQTHQDRSNSV